MKRVLIVLSTLASLLPAVTGAADKLRVVATIPDLADMARQVGGDFVEVTSLATGVEDIHAVPMKPSFAVTLNRADAVVVVGLEAEHAFMPGLLEAARNPKIMPGAPGYIDCSTGIVPLDVPTSLDRAQGEQHPMGNPHFNLDPVMGKDMARAIAEGLSRNYPQHEDTFKKNLDAYLAVLDAAIERWAKETAPPPRGPDDAVLEFDLSAAQEVRRRAFGRRGCGVRASDAKARGHSKFRRMSNNDMHRSRRSAVHVGAGETVRRPGNVGRWAS